MTVKPYKTVDNRIDGVLMTLVDISDIKRSLLKITSAYDYANAIVETVREPLLVLSSDLRVITANKSFYDNSLTTPGETENRFIYELGNRQWDRPELRNLLEKVLPEDKAFSDLAIELETPNMGRRVMILNARRIHLEGPHSKTARNPSDKFDGLILLAIEDITERKKIEDAHLFLVSSGWLASGEDFFEALARYLAKSLDMDFVCIDRLSGDLLSAQTVAVYFDGKFEDNVCYTLRDTPCGDVVEKKVCSFSNGVRKLFPGDVILQDMRAESYVGTTLWSTGGQPIGLIAVIGRKPLADPAPAEWLLKLVSLRAAGELERRQAEEQLKSMLDEKMTLLKELYHRTKNNMNVISGLISLQTVDMPDGTEMRKFQDLQNRIKSMALVHERLYKSRELSNVDLGEYVKDLASALTASYKIGGDKVALKLELDACPISIDTAIPCGLVLNELISNSLKYAFPDQRSGEIGIACRMMQDGEISITYSDNGVGFPKNLDFNTAGTLGLKLVKRLVMNQLKGTVKIETGQGTAFTIVFKDAGSENRCREDK